MKKPRWAYQLKNKSFAVDDMDQRVKTFATKRAAQAWDEAPGILAAGGRLVKGHETFRVVR